MPKQLQLALFNTKEKWLYSDVRASHPISQAEPSDPTEEIYFDTLYPKSHSFSQYSNLMAIGEGWNVDFVVPGKGT